MLTLNHALCSEPSIATTREWLVTNGKGSYAAGTVAGILSRRYHGLLIAALNPPLNRTLLVVKLDPTVRYLDQDYSLHCNQWSENKLELDGLQYLQNFTLDGSVPTWRYAFADAVLEKRVWMEQGHNVTYVQYTLVRGSAPLDLTLDASVNYRDYHENSATGDVMLDVSTVTNGIEFSSDVQRAYLRSDHATVVTAAAWMQDYYHAIEDFRGLEPTDAQFRAATFDVTLNPGESVAVVASLNPDADLDATAALARRQHYDQQLLAQADCTDASPVVQHLVLASDQFIADRPTTQFPDGKTIIAGFPWFADWGRDTMISLPGLTLNTKRYTIARQILETYAQFVDEGMLPNRFPEAGEAPEYNTVDATLWYFRAIHLYYDHTGDDDLLRRLYPTLEAIVDWHRRGTRFGIRVDPDDGLLYAGEPGTQLTWMDVKIKDWVVTPRQGKAVEVNALWLNALQTMRLIATRLRKDDTPYDKLLTLATTNFKRFWNPTTDHCFDVLDGVTGDDAALRPNQLIALALPNCPLDAQQQQKILEQCKKQLYTLAGLRTLSPRDNDYIGQYGGDRVRRDSAYHQGTTWAWLLGPFIDAVINVTGDYELARAYLEPLLHSLLTVRCIGTVSEIFEGDAPFRPRGAFAQAWSVAEILRAWQRIEQGGII
jgi:predicted glycogen debranching enzyme